MIVKTLLDTDLYKFTTSYAYIKLFPYAMGTFSFNDRNETQYTKDFLKALKAEIKNLSQLRFTEEELEYMTKNCRFLPRVYWEWLSSFRFDPNKIDIHLDEACHLHIEVTDLLYKVTLYEVPLLAIVSEIKNRFFGNVADMNEILCKLSEKIELSNQHQLRFSEFGTRRRFSIDVQETVIKKLNETAQYCTGTSNCNFAMKYGMKMMGTHPHEWFMFHGAQFGYKHEKLGLSVGLPWALRLSLQRNQAATPPNIHASEEPMASAPVFHVSFSGEFHRLATMLMHLPFITAMRGYSVSSM